MCVAYMQLPVMAALTWVQEELFVGLPLSLCAHSLAHGHVAEHVIAHESHAPKVVPALQLVEALVALLVVDGPHLRNTQTCVLNPPYVHELQ